MLSLSVMHRTRWKGMSVAENITRIREVLSPRAVTLIAVSKGATMGQIEEAAHTGVTEFGENRVQDALEKMDLLPSGLVNNSHWHFIGHLQKNKVKQAIGRFVLIHSVDSVSLARQISKTAANKGIIQAILLQVKMSYDPDKSGFEPKDLQNSFAEIAQLPNLECRGLMTITPLVTNQAERIACFNGLKLLRDELAQKHNMLLPELSMGMSDDWQEAIQCGATMVRIGREIFQR